MLDQGRSLRTKMKYTCTEYRTEMILLGLKRRLSQDDLSEEERAAVLLEIEEIEKELYS